MDQDQLESNAELVEGEVESIEATLTPQEFQKLDLSRISPSATSELMPIVNLMKMSIIPNFELKVLVTDKEKKR